MTVALTCRRHRVLCLSALLTGFQLYATLRLLTLVPLYIFRLLWLRCGARRQILLSALCALFDTLLTLALLRLCRLF